TVLKGAAARLVDAQVVAHVGHAEDLAEAYGGGRFEAALAIGVAEHAARLHLIEVDPAAAKEATFAAARQSAGEALPEARRTGDRPFGRCGILRCGVDHGREIRGKSLIQD